MLKELLSKSSLYKENNKIDEYVDRVENDEVRFSAHAVKRLEARKIELNCEDISKIKGAIVKAEAKGAKESLVILEKSAMIVNIKNRIVVTAVPVFDGSDSVFTNIDTVIFAN